MTPKCNQALWRSGLSRTWGRTWGPDSHRIFPLSNNCSPKCWCKRRCIPRFLSPPKAGNWGCCPPPLIWCHRRTNTLKRGNFEYAIHNAELEVFLPRKIVRLSSQGTHFLETCLLVVKLVVSRVSLFFRNSQGCRCNVIEWFVALFS